MENKILATVGGMPITSADVDTFLANLGERGAAYNNPQGRAMILGQLINSRLFLMDAQRNLYEAEPAFKEQLRRAKEELLTGYAIEKALSGVKVTDADVKAYYEENSDKFVTGPTVNADHILVKTEEEAVSILAKINAGDISFGDAAKEYSSCPSKENGGNLGDFGQGQMVPEFDTAVFQMNVGEIAGPVQTQFGYHLIRLNSKNEGSTVPFESIKDRLKEQLLGEKQSKAYESRVNQLKIVYPVDLLG